MGKPYIFEFDFGNVLRMTITSAATENPIDLTGKGVKLYWRRGEEIVERECSIVDAENGVVQYYVEQGDFEPGGTYSLQLKVTGTGVRFSTSMKTLRVNEIIYKTHVENLMANSYLKIA